MRQKWKNGKYFLKKRKKHLHFVKGYAIILERVERVVCAGSSVG